MNSTVAAVSLVSECIQQRLKWFMSLVSIDGKELRLHVSNMLTLVSYINKKPTKKIEGQKMFVIQC